MGVASVIMVLSIIGFAVSLYKWKSIEHKIQREKNARIKTNKKNFG